MLTDASYIAFDNFMGYFWANSYIIFAGMLWYFQNISTYVYI